MIILLKQVRDKKLTISNWLILTVPPPYLPLIHSFMNARFKGLSVMAGEKASNFFKRLSIPLYLPLLTGLTIYW